MMIPHSRLIFNLILFSLLFLNVKTKTSQNSCLVRHINSLYRLSNTYSFLVYSSSASAHHITSQLTWHWWWQRNTIRKSERDMLVKAQKGISNYLCLFFFANIHNIFHLILSAQPYWLVCLINRNRINVRALRATTIKKPAVGGNGKLCARIALLCGEEWTLVWLQTLIRSITAMFP